MPEIIVSKTFGSGDDKYECNIHFTDADDAAEAGAKYVVWKLQQQARQGKIQPDTVYEVNSKGEVHKTDEQLWAEMSPEQKARFKALVMADEAVNG